MDLTDEQIEVVIDKLCVDFASDIGLFFADLAKDILIRLGSFSHNNKNDILLRCLINLISCQLTRYVCVFDDSSQAYIYDRIKTTGLESGDSIRKLLYE